jgi:hypothetical protein
MRSAPSPEEIHAILSRFQTWAEKHPVEGNGNGHKNGAASEEVREIPYEEAIRQYRRRRTAQAPRRPAPPAKKPAAGSQLASVHTGPAPTPEISEDLPQWVADLPVVYPTEPVIELRAASAPIVRQSPADETQPATEAEERIVTGRPAGRSSAARATKTRALVQSREAEDTKPAPSAVQPELSAGTPVNLPLTALPSRHSHVRRTPSQPAQATASFPAQVPLPETHSAARKARPIVRAQASPQPTKRPAAPPPRLSTPAANAGRSSAPKQANRNLACKPVAKRAPVPAKSAILRPPIQVTPPLSPRRVAAKAKPRAAARAPFRRVLANTLQQPKAALVPGKKPAPDRTQRITTRFTPAEERRIAKQAAQSGITVSAYLRQCALTALAAQTAARDDEPIAAIGKARKATAQGSWQPKAHAAAPPSLLAGWLALLRNRFLGPPVRFSEEA